MTSPQTATPTEIQAIQALLVLHNAVMDVAAELREDQESPVEIAQRLQKTYGTINVPVGIRARTLIDLFKALQGAVAAIPYDAPSLAPHLKQAMDPRIQYGPARRSLPGRIG